MKRTTKKQTPSTTIEAPVEPVVETPTVKLVDESSEREPYFDMIGLNESADEAPNAETEAETALTTELVFDSNLTDDSDAAVVTLSADNADAIIEHLDKLVNGSNELASDHVESDESAELPPPPAEIMVDMSNLPASDEAPKPVDKVSEIAAAIRGLGVTSNFEIIETATKMELISKAILAPEVAFFRKSFGDKARKPHLRNYAPGYSLEKLIEVGLAFHETKSVVSETNAVAWKQYEQPLSYALLGMAVLTGRNPGMPNGKYTKIGSSFNKHQEDLWAAAFKANRLFMESREIKAAPVVEPVVEAPKTETVASIDAELQATIAATKSKKRGGKKQPVQAAA